MTIPTTDEIRTACEDGSRQSRVRALFGGQMTQPPKAIWLQFYGEDRPSEDVDIRTDISWCTDQIFATDVRYVIDKRYRKKRKRKAK